MRPWNCSATTTRSWSRSASRRRTISFPPRPWPQGFLPIPAPTIPSDGILDLPLNVGFEGQPQNLHRGYIESWNLMVQKELGKGLVVQAGYVANRSMRQLGFLDINASQIPFTNRDTQPLLQQWGRTATTTFLEPWEPATTIRFRSRWRNGSAAGSCSRRTTRGVTRSTSLTTASGSGRYSRPRISR